MLITMWNAVNRRLLATAAVALPIVLTYGVAAAEIKVLSAVAMKPALDDLAPKFERATGHRLTISYEVAGELRKRIESGEFGDVTILPRPWFEPLLTQGKIAAHSQTIIARSTVGVSVRVGTPKPDISSVAAVRQSLLAAGSVVYADPARGASSGVHFVAVLEKLGIVDEMRPKTILIPGAGAAEVVARGEAQLAVSQTQDLIRVAGADYVGPLPPELQNTTDMVYSAGVLTSANDPDAAKALIKFLSGPEAVRVIKEKGMEPALGKAAL